MAGNGVKKQRGPGRPFPKGVSGNPAGKPKGLRNKATLAAEALLDGEAEALTRKAVDLALAGDTTALRLCLERIAPPRKDRPLPEINLPTLGAENLAKVSAAVLQAVAGGELTPSEGQALAGLLEQHRKCVEIEEIEKRLAAIEANMEAKK